MTKPTIDLENVVLAQGGHSSPETGMCLLEAVSYVAGEKFSDRPVCVSLVLGAFGRTLNDGLSQDDRQRLKPFIPLMLNTANDGQDDARRYLAADWAFRVSLPRWLDLAGRTKAADDLRSLLPVTNFATLRLARDLVRDLYPDAYQARSDAYASLRTKVREAVRAEFAKTGVKAAEAAAVAVAEAAEAEVAAVAVAEAVAEVAAAAAAVAAAAVAAAAVAAEVAEVAAEVADPWGSYYWTVREAVRAKLDSLDATEPGTFSYVRKINLDEGIALLGRMIDPSAAAA